MAVSRLTGPLALALALAVGVPAGAAGDHVTTLDRIPRARILEAAGTIDRLVEADLAAHKIQPNPLIDDATFVRRAYLDLAGRIPTSEEASAFLSSAAPDRRAALIDQLLLSPGHASHMFNWLADLLRVKSRIQNQISGEPYIHHIKESLARNKPWDVFVRELLTASGNAHKRNNGATGYILRDRGMLEDNMSNTITLFLGTRLECAQCHNHPFDKWTQLQYHEMVAFAGGIRYSDDALRASPEGKRLEAMGEVYRGQNGQQRGRENFEFQAFRQMLLPLQYGVSGTGTGLYRLPKDYQYKDAKANQVVKAKSMFGKDVELSADPAAADRRPVAPDRRNNRAPEVRANEINSREAYARWLTSTENPRFTTVIANRLWKRLFGVGVIEPVDILRDATKPINAPLMKHLETVMVEVGYDLRQYLRALANSRTYQREASRTEASDEEPYRFPGPLLRRLSAEQLWDSMLTLVVTDLDQKLVKPAEGAEPVYAEYERLLALTPEEVKKAVEIGKLRYSDPQKYREMLQREQDQFRKAAEEHRQKERALQEQQQAARRKGDEEAARKIKEEIDALAKLAPQPPRIGNGGYRRGGNNNGLARASDLPQPAPPGHFLREFGQSDREQIEASHKLAAVPQALSLLNGFVDRNILPNRGAALRQAAAAATSPSEKVRALFRCVLSRDPSAAEQEAWTPGVEKRGDAAIGDLIWTLVNTHEFMFIR